MAKSEPHERTDVDDRSSGDAVRVDGVRGAEKQQDPDAPTPTPDYRFVAVLLVLAGGIVVTLSWVFGTGRPFLLTVGAIGMFGGLLMYYLTRGRFVSERVPAHVYESMVRNQRAIVDAVEHADTPVYIPSSDTTILYVPRKVTDPIPEPEAVTAPAVSPDAGTGLAFVPTGARLFEEFRASVVGSIAEDPETLAIQLEEGLVETFEIAGDTEFQLDANSGRLDMEIRDAVFPPGFDTPAASFLAVGLAQGLNTAIITEKPRDENGSYTVTCHWNPERIGTGD